MSLYLCRTADRQTGETNTFLVSAHSAESAVSMINDHITHVTDIFDTTEMEEVIINQYDGLALLANV